MSGSGQPEGIQIEIRMTILVAGDVLFFKIKIVVDSIDPDISWKLGNKKFKKIP